MTPEVFLERDSLVPWRDLDLELALDPALFDCGGPSLLESSVGVESGFTSDLLSGSVTTIGTKRLKSCWLGS